MKKIRTLNLFGLICNIAIGVLFALSIVAIMKAGTGSEYTNFNAFTRYDVLATIVTLVAAGLMLIANIVSIARGKTSVPRLFTLILLTAAVMSSVALIVNICFPHYNGITDINQLFSVEGGYLYFGFLIPVLSVVEFLFLAIDKKIKWPAIFVPFTVTVIYLVAIIVTMVVTDNPNLTRYEFLQILPKWAGDKLTQNIVILIIFIAVSFGLGLVLWLINRINNMIVYGVSIKEYESKEKAKKTGKKEDNAVKKGSFGTYLKRSISFNENYDEDNTRVYHISYHNRKLKTWKVKGEEAGRALKVFDTQKEAIEYAKFLVAKNGGSIRIHSMLGRIRKDW